MISTIIATALLAFIAGAACFIAGCIFWDTKYVPSPKNLIISDATREFLEKNDYQINIFQSVTDEGALSIWVKDNKINGDASEPMILVNPKKRTLKVLG